MSGLPSRRITLPRDRDAWQSARDARRKVLEKVRARRRRIFITMLARAAVKAKRQNHRE